MSLARLAALALRGAQPVEGREAALAPAFDPLAALDSAMPLPAEVPAATRRADMPIARVAAPAERISMRELPAAVTTKPPQLAAPVPANSGIPAIAAAPAVQAAQVAEMHVMVAPDIAAQAAAPPVPLAITEGIGTAQATPATPIAPAPASGPAPGEAATHGFAGAVVPPPRQPAPQPILPAPVAAPPRLASLPHAPAMPDAVPEIQIGRVEVVMAPPPAPPRRDAPRTAPSPAPDRGFSRYAAMRAARDRGW